MCRISSDGRPTVVTALLTVSLPKQSRGSTSVVEEEVEEDIERREEEEDFGETQPAAVTASNDLQNTVHTVYSGRTVHLACRLTIDDKHSLLECNFFLAN